MREYVSVTLTYRAHAHDDRSLTGSIEFVTESAGRHLSGIDGSQNQQVHRDSTFGNS
jgi:hypothetical protein